MLQSKLNSCRVLMSEVSHNKQKDNEQQNTAKKNNTFFDAYNKYLLPIIKGYTICEKYRHVTFSDKTHDDLEKLIIYSKQTIEQKVVVNPTKYQEGVKKISERIQKEWEEQTNEYLKEIKEELGIFKLVSNEKQEIQNILSCLNDFANWPDENKASNYDRAILMADNILVRMEYDDEIMGFLKKVKNKEASLLDLTEPIMGWIRKEELSGNIILSIK